MKKTLSIILVGLCGTVSAMQPQHQFPTKEQITEQLEAGKIPAHVAEQLQIPEKFANQTMDAAQINATLKTVFGEFVQTIDDPEKKEKTRKHLSKEKPMLVKVLLKESPDVLAAVLQRDDAQ
jgi:nitrate/TMAO reductase-like tetraheme cytochrome c subunit